MIEICNFSEDEWLGSHNSDYSDRDKVVNLLKEKFGETNVIPITNFNKLQLRSLTKDISKLYSVPFQEVNEITNGLEEEVLDKICDVGDNKAEKRANITYSDAIEHCPKFKAYIDKYPHVGEHINILYKQNRSLSMHAGGVLICDDIYKKMPLIYVRGNFQSAWGEGLTVKHLSPFGFVKFDLLGIGTLRIFERCIELILQRHHSIENPTFEQVRQWYDANLHPDKLDLNDQKVYKHVYWNQNWAGIFQFDQPHARNFVSEIKPTCIEDIAIATSICRPGPLSAGVDKSYIEACNDPSSIEYDHELIKKVLEPTKGFLIFQESASLLGKHVAGLDDATCEKLRKLTTKVTSTGVDKAKKEAEELEKLFVAGAIKNGVEEHIAKSLFEKIKNLVSYAFNKSHAVCYAINSYICAWLLTYYEEEWLCAYLEYSQDNPDARQQAISEIKSFGYQIGKVDINRSNKSWIINKNKVFVPALLTCKGVGEAAIEEILLKRPYRSLDEFLWEVSPETGKFSWKHSKFNKRCVEALIKIEAFDSLDIVGPGKIFDNYRQMHSVLIENWDALKKKSGKEKLQELISSTKGMEDWSNLEKMQFQKEILGNIDISLLITEKMINSLRSNEIYSIDSPGTYNWFILTDVIKKRTKAKNKEYAVLECLGESGKQHKIYFWTYKGQELDINAPYICQLEINDFGMSTKQIKKI